MNTSPAHLLSSSLMVSLASRCTDEGRGRGVHSTAARAGRRAPAGTRRERRAQRLKKTRAVAERRGGGGRTEPRPPLARPRGPYFLETLVWALTIFPRCDRGSAATLSTAIETGPSSGFVVCFSFRAVHRAARRVSCRAFRSGRLPPACASIDWHTFAMLFQWQLHPERSPTHCRWGYADRHAACNAAETPHATHRSRCLAKSGPSLQSSQRHCSE